MIITRTMTSKKVAGSSASQQTDRVLGPFALITHCDTFAMGLFALRGSVRADN